MSTSDSMNLLSSGPAGPVKFGEVAVLLGAGDHVAVAKQSLRPGTVLILDDGSELRISQMVPTGHKFALKPVASGEPVIRYGQNIGFATQDIKTGQHVHVQNLNIQGMGKSQARLRFLRGLRTGRTRS